MKFNKIASDIKNLKIQGAENIARAAVKALMLRHDKKAVKKLLSLRSTEPCLRNAIKFSLLNIKKNTKLAIKHFDEAQEKIANIGSKKIKNNFIVFTHCHSSTVINVLKKAKQQRKKFKVYNTETRPLYQGRITAKELTKLKIPVTHFIDSAGRIALKEANIMLIGCDAITTDKIYNKIGSEIFAEIAYKYDVPVYVCSDSWKFDPRSIFGKEEPIEKRSSKEVWENPPKGVKILNPAFEKINPELITSIISELGEYKLSSFINEVKKVYPWLI